MNNTVHASSLPAKFIPFRDFHIAPLTDVSPEAFKQAAEEARTTFRGRAELPHTTALNHIAKTLGFEGGFSGFQQEYACKVLPFMRDHGLKGRADLIRPRSDFPFVDLTPRNVSDRLFLSKKRVPKRIFTGYAVDWFSLNDRYFRSNPWTQVQEKEGKLFFLTFDQVMKEVDQQKSVSLESAQEVFDAAIAACQPAINPPSNNLLGDQLVQNCEELEEYFTFVPGLYQPTGLSAEKFNEEQRRYREVARLFRTWIGQLDRGWVEVHPYNRSLFFLKGNDGDYDFVFPGFRDQALEQAEIQSNSQTDDLEKASALHNFRHWLYFAYSGWLEDDAHRAEMLFYSLGNVPASYPGAEHVLKEFFTHVRAYPPPPTKEGIQSHLAESK
ncbi:MAG: hypothetical protein EBY17_28150 [Acidobacteriia bacterium]|nr:hypothetical protein [Terriglobia bacterium]